MAGGGVVLVGAPRLRLYYIYSPILSFPKKEMFSKNVFQKRKCFSYSNNDRKCFSYSNGGGGA